MTKRTTTWKDVAEALKNSRARGCYISEAICETPKCLRDNNGWIMARTPLQALRFVQSCR